MPRRVPITSVTSVATSPYVSASVPPSAKKKTEHVRPLNDMAKLNGERFQWSGTLRSA
jgi:hypothetical protein